MFGGVCGRIPKHFRDLEKMLVRGGGVMRLMPKYFTDLKNVGGGKCSNSLNNRARIKMKAVLERIFHKLSHAHIKLMIC